jgi:putative ABC transport system ATP-binding protein
MIVLRDIKKEYWNKESVTVALKGVDLTIEKGDFLAIVGTSGAGKTTLLNIIGGMDRATSGQYECDGADISAYSQKELHRYRKEYISFVFQHFELMEDYTVYENVEMPMLARKVEKKERQQRIMRILEYFGMESIKDKKPNQLSGGQQQRCAIARAIAADTPILLADEPTGALDKKTGEQIMRCFEEINIKGKTVIIITHDMEIASRCKRIVRIEDGQIV